MTEPERMYYDRRAPEYDDWYLGTGLFAERVRPGWHEEVEALQAQLREIPMLSVLDVACGTGFLTRNLTGRVVGLDQSSAMLRIARERVPGGRVLQGDALRLPFRAGAFESLLTYGHLDEATLDAAWREDVQPEEVQERILQDGSRHSVYKRYFTPDQLAAELGGARVLHGGRWFVAVLA